MGETRAERRRAYTLIRQAECNGNLCRQSHIFHLRCTAPPRLGGSQLHLQEFNDAVNRVSESDTFARPPRDTSSLYRNGVRRAGTASESAGVGTASGPSSMQWIFSKLDPRDEARGEKLQEQEVGHYEVTVRCSVPVASACDET
ncbi:hypothetical protein DPEC_G00242500 [Dallia pectoralis]|uniref:Uncharacterized protein n=1 Tax=Dallia pectoralis TaxID=75939 RepID=A0ACC2FV61_DALPE|nr:hypothetical protein DPEC_G00242500 [Dallia pectoralis]